MVTNDKVGISAQQIKWIWFMSLESKTVEIWGEPLVALKVLAQVDNKCAGDHN